MMLGGTRMFGKKNKGNSGDVSSRVAAIQSLAGSMQKKKKGDSDEKRMHQLLEYLKDESPECRIAAAEALASSSSELVITYISHYLDSEKDENVLKAMKATLASVRVNVHESR